MGRRAQTTFALALLAALASVAGAESPPLAIEGAAPREAPLRLGKSLATGRTLEGGTPHRLLHFTFDDGPDPRTTPGLLDALDRAGWRATFFLSTSRFDSRERRNQGTADLAREVARRGHWVGSHSHDHVRMGRLSPAELRSQLDQSRAAFERVFGSRTWLFRPPFGSRNRALERYLAGGSYTTVMWNVGLADWVERPPEAVEATFWKVLARNERLDGQRGGIVLMHDTHDWSVKAFERIAASIARRNCELLAAGEELYDVVDSLGPFVEPLGADVLERRQRALRGRLAPRCEPERMPSRAGKAFRGKNPP